MKEEILQYLDNPKELELLYRKNKAKFGIVFNELYPEIKEHTCAPIWFERLNFETKNESVIKLNDLLFVFALALLAALLAKLPDIFSIEKEFFFTRNVGFMVFPLLAIFFIQKQLIPLKQLVGVGILLLLSIVYINWLPANNHSDTLNLACIHLPFVLWFLTGFAFVGNTGNNDLRRLDFLRYNGDLLVMMALLAIAGGILSAITIGLFSLIDIHIEEFYRDYIVVSGLAALPVFATFLVQFNPQLVNKVSPVIAGIFAPLVFVMLVLYLVAILFSGKDPYNDREFLLIFNLLLVGVMAIIFFSIAEIAKTKYIKMAILVLLGLSLVTIMVNGIALSAIVFRINEWGITPNRLSVFGSNLLVLINLVWVAYRLFRAINNNETIDTVQKRIALFLPVYLLWAIAVTFIFPVLFNFR